MIIMPGLSMNFVTSIALVSVNVKSRLIYQRHCAEI